MGSEKDCCDIAVDRNGNWRLYTNTIPGNSTPLGVVIRDGRDAGALVRIDTTGEYVQVNASVMRRLDGRKVAAALGISGRPSEMESGRRVNIYIDHDSLDIARRLGGGNISLGVRKALRQAGKQ